MGEAESVFKRVLNSQVYVPVDLVGRVCWEWIEARQCV